MSADAVVPYGDRALEVLLPRPDLQWAQHLARRLRAMREPAILDCVAGWETVLVHLASTHASTHARMRTRITELVREELAKGGAPRDAEISVRLHEVLVHYDGPDLVEVASACGLSVDEVIRLHADTTYVVAMVGFLPGFAYLQSVEPRLRLPRRATPRVRVPAGSVAIAEDMTAIYPMESPGGWHLLGRAMDVRPFDAGRSPPSLFLSGDRVRFVRRR